MKKFRVFALSLAALSFCLAGSPPSASAFGGSGFPGSEIGYAIMAVYLPVAIVTLPVWYPIASIQDGFDQKALRREERARQEELQRIGREWADRRAGIARPDKPATEARKKRERPPRQPRRSPGAPEEKKTNLWGY